MFIVILLYTAQCILLYSIAKAAAAAHSGVDGVQGWMGPVL